MPLRFCFAFLPALPERRSILHCAHGSQARGIVCLTGSWKRGMMRAGGRAEPRRMTRRDRWIRGRLIATTPHFFCDSENRPAIVVSGGEHYDLLPAYDTAKGVSIDEFNRGLE